MPRNEHAPLRNGYSSAPALLAHLFNGWVLRGIDPALVKEVQDVARLQRLRVAHDWDVVVAFCATPALAR